jgi:hypothetical protein
MKQNKGHFKKDNKVAKKQRYCPYCNNKLQIYVYTHITKKIESGRLKTDISTPISTQGG